MKSAPLFASGCVVVDLTAVSKKQLFQELAEFTVRGGTLAANKIGARDIVSAVLDRERLGSTGVGSGVAIPHARINGLNGVKAVFARLENPIDYEAIDDKPVDLVVLLLAPVGAGAAHLKALAQISRLLRREGMRNRLRNAPTAEALHLLLSDERAASAA